jgi:hypothetical protein
MYSELSRRQDVSVTRPRPEVNPCKDYVKRLRKVLKLRQGVFREIWRHIVIWTKWIQVLNLENTTNLCEEVKFQNLDFSKFPIELGSIFLTTLCSLFNEL